MSVLVKYKILYPTRADTWVCPYDPIRCGPGDGRRLINGKCELAIASYGQRSAGEGAHESGTAHHNEQVVNNTNIMALGHRPFASK